MSTGLKIPRYKTRMLYIASLLFVAFGLLGAVLSTDHKTAYAVVAGASSTNKDSHRARCDGAGHPFVDFSLKIEDINLDVATGNVNYTAEVKYQACRNQTRAYAIYGKNFCENLGNYGGAGDGATQAYDCVKYVGNPAFQNYGTQLTCGGGNTNNVCLYQPTRWRNLNYIVEEAQPPTSPERTVKTTFSGQLTVPNWNNKKQVSGSYDFDIDGIICQYYKYGNNFTENTQNGGDEQKRCIQNTRITVSWTAEWSVTPSNTMLVNGVVRGNSYADPYVVYVGDSVVWQHSIRNNGPEQTNSNVSWSVYQDTSPGPGGEVTINNYSWPAYRPAGASYGYNGSFSPQPSDAGKHVCQANSATPQSYNNGSFIGTNWYCVRTVYYRITPSLDSMQPSFIGEPGNPSGRVTHTGIVEGNHEIKLSAYRYNDTRIKTSGLLGARASSGEAPCGISQLTSAAGYSGQCRETSPAIGNYDSANPMSINKAFSTFGFTGPYPVGTTFCFVLSVKDPTENPGDNNNWFHSAVQCTTSAKKPNVHFLGSDVRVAGRATAGNSIIDGLTYGSWVEYGMFSSDVNSFVASGNGLRGGMTGARSDWSNLTFSNTDTTRYGDYTPVPAASSAYAYFNSLNPGGTGIPDTGVYDLAGSTTGRIDVTSNGKSVIIRKNGNLTIDQDITVSNTGLTNAANISQVVILADNITIAEGVSRVDAWLITKTKPVSGPGGYINTCGNMAALTTAICNTPLVINGPIYTDRLMLRRTGGADLPKENLGDPAETFNLRPDAQLWAYNYANKADYAQTDYVQELPPRY